MASWSDLHCFLRTEELYSIFSSGASTLIAAERRLKIHVYHLGVDEEIMLRIIKVLTIKSK